MINIHSTAIVSSKAKLGQNVSIGPYCIINSNVILGNNCNLKANVYIDGHTEIGENSECLNGSGVKPLLALNTITD